MLQHYTTKSGMPKQWHELTNRPFPFAVVTTWYFLRIIGFFLFCTGAAEAKLSRGKSIFL